jgi:hypothetical protein
VSSDAASSYASGGGGVSLEHQYAATLLARLLVGAPASELGDRIELKTVRMQGGDVSPVDDLVLDGVAATGDTHRASIGVRRDPNLTTSDSKSVPLIRSYLRIAADHWNEVSTGRWSLTLAVAKPRPTFQQVDALAALARSAADAAAFAEAVARPAATNAPTRKRLQHLRSLVEQASDGDASLTALGVDELTWRWLAALQVKVLRLEGSDTSDRTSAVTVLQQAVVDGTIATADTVFSRLAELAGMYAAQGAAVTGGMLRRELSTLPLKHSGAHNRAWRLFDRFGALLRNQTGSTITADSTSIRLDRADAANALRNAIEHAGSTGGGLVITGEPDVGKSALTVRVCGELGDAGAVVIAVSLRDLRGSVLDLESALGGVSVDDLFGGAATGTTRLLVVDGCEAVLEGQGLLFGALAAAAASAGMGVVGVTRSDGSRYVREALAGAFRTAGRPDEVVEHVVGELAAQERTELAASIQTLARVHADPRTAWLLGRPGLVDAVLRSGTSVESGRLLCEADVFSAVWNGLIRRNETQPPGSAAPDDREAAAVAIASRRLGGHGSPPGQAQGQALRELRSDGVLRADANPAFSQGPEFSTDLYRDFALCRLFLISGWQPLKDAGAPRWPIRAVRLACQARLANLAAGDRAIAWAALTAEFAELAESQGVRWAEVPYEALLTLGDARDAIRHLWDALVGGDGLQTLLRLAAVRYVHGTFGDPFTLAPIVEVAFCEDRVQGRHGRGSRQTPQERLAELVLAWLRGLGSADRGPNPLRQRVRDTILAQDRPLYDEFAIEALATLGPDLNDAAEAWLRKVAEERPSSLHPVPESPGVVVSLSHIKPDLLLELSEAFYIEKPDPDDRWGHGWGRGSLDDGIRDYKHGLGFGAPQAAWYYGPFHRLLHSSPVKTIAFINRMLNQAALFRVTDIPPRDSNPAWEEYEGVTLELTEKSNPRRYVGDSHVWCWYRGTSVGPYSCMSALLALEKFIDHLHDTLRLPAGAIIDLLLPGCHNLAVPGLIAGFLTRHLEDAGDLLDPFLGEVDVWHLETARATSEHGFRVRDADADKLAGQDKRRFSPHETVGWMVVNARLRGDENRLERLERVGDRLVESAQRKTEQLNTGGRDEAEEYLAMVQSWAAEFRISSYEATTVDGGVRIQFERPAEIDKVLAPRTAELETVGVLYGLQRRYALKNEHPEDWPVDSLIEDVATARAIVDAGPPAEFMWPENPIVAVAAAAIRAHANGTVELDESDLAWAAEMVLLAAEQPQIDELSSASTLFSMGADRAAAIAVPLLLLEPFDKLSLDPERVRRALAALASSTFDEVRTAYGNGCAPVWGAPCSLDETGACHRHAPEWEAVDQSLSASRLGPWDVETQGRRPGTLEPPYDATLPEVPTEELLVNRLRMPLVCLAGAANAACLASAVERLSAPLWDAHRRGLDHWWREGYDHLGDRHHEPVARLLIEEAMRGERKVLDEHLRTLASNAHALQTFMDSFARIFSYDERLRPYLAAVWVPSLATVLDAIDDGADLFDDRGSWFDWAVASLLPTPQLESGDIDPDATLNRCREGWADPDEFASLIDRWVAIAKGQPRAADAVAQLATTAPISWQASTGLDWLEAIIDGRHSEFSNRIWFATNWLRELRSSGAVTGPVVPRFRRLVDGLAVGGDGGAVSMQLLEE